MSTGFGPDPHHTGYAATAYQPGAGRGRNPAGRLALVAGILVVLIGLVQQVLALLLPYLMHRYDLSASAVSLRFNLIGGIVTTVFALVALIAGGIGLSGTGKPKAAAGAGLALGVTAVLSVLMALIAPSIITAVV
ncbi:hypothetical protein [Ruania zhangjianzhongii]|uniref:hypothetical protein n=1 Tax=Ruania zhangjianzhongii TaxID=2603206 RepID=UPI0011CAFED3|nr:hypothetical protein [Ruania zhangjianzhongii]